MERDISERAAVPRDGSSLSSALQSTTYASAATQARQNGIVGLLLRETMRIVFLGLVIGLGLAYIGLRLIQTQLFDVAPQDPIIVGSALGMFLLVALSAAYIPARRASRLDPIVALRGE